MIKKIRRKFGNSLFIFIFLHCTNLHSADFVLALQHGDPDLFSYAVSLLELAIKQDDEEHSFKIIQKPTMTEGRMLNLLIQDQDEFNIFIGGHTQKNVENANIVNVPISRGLLGHRLFIIHKNNYDLLETVDSLEKFKVLASIGSGFQWLDTDIFKHNGFEVEVAGFEQLWTMLDKQRFVAFNRGMFEAFSEIKSYGKLFPELVVYPNLMVSYKFDYFFYTNKKNDHLREILERSIKRLYESGKFMRHFYEHPHIAQAFNSLDFNVMKIFPLKNPFIENISESIPAKYWHEIKLDSL